MQDGPIGTVAGLAEGLIVWRLADGKILLGLEIRPTLLFLFRKASIVRVLTTDVIAVDHELDIGVLEQLAWVPTRIGVDAGAVDALDDGVR